MKETLTNQSNDNKRKALGRGLEQLFSNESLYVNPLETLDEIVEITPKDEVQEISLDELRSNPYQPRKTFDDEKLNELAASINEYGVLEPIIVKKAVHGYEIVAGERRKKACEIAGLKTIPCIVKDFSDETMMQIALLENIQREDLTAIEEAEAYYKIIKLLNITQDEFARRIGKSRSYVTNMLGLLRLPESVKADILEGSISMGHARLLSKIEDKDLIRKLAEKIKNDHLSVRELEALAQSEQFPKVKDVKRHKEPSKFEFVADAITDKIGNKVKVSDKKIVISFNSEKDLARILDVLNIEVKVD